jgi:hypothetical protein
MGGGFSSGGQVSPDGRWRWDGTKWVPIQGTEPNPMLAHQPPAQLPALYQQTPQAYPGSVYVYGPRTNSYAVASLVFGIISWILCPCLGGLFAVFLGHVARSQIRQTGEGGGGLATAGLVLGYIHLAAFVLIFLFWIVVAGGLTALLGAIGIAIGNLPTPTPTP